MSYNKLGFVSGQTLKADHLNHIEAGFEETLAMAKAYTDSQRVGYTETKKGTVTFDGDLTGRTTLPGSLVGLPESHIFVKVMDTVIDENGFDSVTLRLKNEEETFNRSDMTIRRYGATMFLAPDTDSALVAIIPKDLADSQGVEAGTYILHIEDNVTDEGVVLETGPYVSAIHGVMVEVIHPIDQKFLPKGGVGYVETQRAHIIGETTVDFQPNPDLGGFAVAVLEITGTVDAYEGETVIVEFDGQDYKCVVFDDGNGQATVGNLGIIGVGVDTGEPFVASSVPGDMGKRDMLVIAEAGEHTFALCKETETIHPIDPKFLPGVCLPVVELGTTVSHGVWFTAEENAKLKAAYEGNTPVIIRCNITVDTDNAENACAVWTKLGGAAPRFIYSYGAAVVCIASQDGGFTWLCMIETAIGV